MERTLSMTPSSEALSLKNLATSSVVTPCTIELLSPGGGSEGMYVSHMAVRAVNWVALSVCARGGSHFRSAGWPCMITGFFSSILSVLPLLVAAAEWPALHAISEDNRAIQNPGTS